MSITLALVIERPWPIAAKLGAVPYPRLLTRQMRGMVVGCGSALSEAKPTRTRQLLISTPSNAE